MAKKLQISTYLGSNFFSSNSSSLGLLFGPVLIISLFFSFSSDIINLAKKIYLFYLSNQTKIPHHHLSFVIVNSDYFRHFTKNKKIKNVNITSCARIIELSICIHHQVHQMHHQIHHNKNFWSIFQNM